MRVKKMRKQDIQVERERGKERNRTREKEEVRRRKREEQDQRERGSQKEEKRGIGPERKRESEGGKESKCTHYKVGWIQKKSLSQYKCCNSVLMNTQNLNHLKIFQCVMSGVGFILLFRLTRIFDQIFFFPLNNKKRN